MVEKDIFEYLNAKIGNPIGAAALMGNLYAESTLNPLCANKAMQRFAETGKQYTERIDKDYTDAFSMDGIAYGIAQWYYPTRKRGLLKKAKESNASIGDIKIQLEYLIEEIKTYKSVYQALVTATDVAQASEIVMVKYEKPANQSQTMKDRRAGYAQRYYDIYCKKPKSLSINSSFAKELLNKLEKAGLGRG